MESSPSLRLTPGNGWSLTTTHSWRHSSYTTWRANVTYYRSKGNKTFYVTMHIMTSLNIHWRQDNILTSQNIHWRQYTYTDVIIHILRSRQTKYWRLCVNILTYWRHCPHWCHYPAPSYLQVDVVCPSRADSYLPQLWPYRGLLRLYHGRD